MQALFGFLVVGDILKSEWCLVKRRSLFELTKTNYALHKHISACVDVLETNGK